MDDLIERLRARAEASGGDKLLEEAAAALEAAREEVDALKAENDRMREAINRCQGGSLIACCISF